MMDRLLTPATSGDRWLRSGPSRMSIKLTLTTCSLVNKCGLIDEGKLQEVLQSTLSKSEKPLCIFNFQPTGLEQPNDLINVF